MATQPPSQTASQDRAPDLWKKAYQALYLENPELVNAYQNLVLEYDTVNTSENKGRKGSDIGRSTDAGKGNKAGINKASTTAIEAHLKLNREQITSFLSKKVETAQKQANIHLKIGKHKEVDIDVGEQVNRIVKGIICAKDFIGSIVSNEPHAAIAWAGVCVILPVRTCKVSLGIRVLRQESGEGAPKVRLLRAPSHADDE